MEVFRNERVVCSIVKYSFFVFLAVGVYIVFDDRIPESLDSLSVSALGSSATISGTSETGSSVSLSFPELKERVSEIASVVQNEELRNIGFMLYNSIDGYPGAQDITPHQACSALEAITSNSRGLSSCSLRELNEMEQALSVLHEGYILDQFQWGNDPLRLPRYRLSRLGFDLVNVLQRDLINRGEFEIEDRNRFDLRKKDWYADLDDFQSY